MCMIVLDSNGTDPQMTKGHHKSSLVPADNSPSPGLDVELAKAIKVFFRDMRNVQHQLKEMRDTGKIPFMIHSMIW